MLSPLRSAPPVRGAGAREVQRKVLSLPRLLVGAAAALLFLSLVGCPGGGGKGSDTLSGTYEAKTPELTWTLEFKSGNKVHQVMSPKGEKSETADAEYLVEGDHVTIQVPGGAMPLTLTRKPNTLETNFMGQILIFAKK